MYAGIRFNAFKDESDNAEPLAQIVALSHTRRGVI